MGCNLDKWVFFAEQKENGNMVRFAKNFSDMKVYRWEPLTTRLVGHEAGNFRKGIMDRNKFFDHLNSDDLGILPVFGPHFYQGFFWMGWEDRKGENLLRQLEDRITPLAQIVKDLYPLIHAYGNYHRLGLVVGRPDWGRLFRDHRGIYMIDPVYLSFLATPVYSPSLGLLGCRPPEAFDGAELNQSGDLFYLGLIIYLAITGRLPFALTNQWPTKALLKGEIISPVISRSDLSPLLAGRLKDVLNPDPEKRGTIQQLEGIWRLMLEQKSYLATAKAQTFNLEQQRVFYKKSRLKKYYKPALAIIASSLSLLIIIQSILIPILSRQYRLKTSPLNAVKEFYRTVAGPPQMPLTAQMNPMLISDFTQTRENRLKTATELITQPLVTVQGTRLISRTNTNRQVVVEVSINCWDWHNGSWRIQPYREILKLRSSGRKWSVINREKL